MNTYNDLEKLLNNQFLGDTELSRYLFKRNFGKTSNEKVKKYLLLDWLDQEQLLCLIKYLQWMKLLQFNISICHLFYLQD